MGASLLTRFYLECLVSYLNFHIQSCKSLLPICITRIYVLLHPIHLILHLSVNSFIDGE